ncbi:MZT2A protein, partial [Leptocoma aspasia]|nr:MZT2A protein [Leptocoma aspasia]
EGAWPTRGRGRAAMSEGAAGMAATAAMAETRLRRKQLLSAEEAELFELAQAAGSGLDPEVFRFLLLKAYLGLRFLSFLQVIFSCLLLDTRQCFFLPLVLKTAWRNKTSSAVSGSQILAERSNREGSAQRMPRQPSTSRTQKAGTSGKSSGGGNS